MLYSAGKPATFTLNAQTGAPREILEPAYEALGEFQELCSQHFAALVVGNMGRLRSQRMVSSAIRKPGPDKARRVILYSHPARGVIVEPHKDEAPGLLVSMDADEFHTALISGGSIENIQSMSFLVTIFSLWEGHTRNLISEAFEVPPDAVTCDLMGDIRTLRNAFLHDKGRISKENNRQTPVLRDIWGEEKVSGDYWLVSHEMVQAVMEQLADLHVSVGGRLARPYSGETMFSKLSDVEVTYEALSAFLCVLGGTLASGSSESLESFHAAMDGNISNFLQAKPAIAPKDATGMRELHGILRDWTEEISPLIESAGGETGEGTQRSP